MDIWHWLLIILIVWDFRKSLINNFKIGYYEEKLKNRKIDISHVENIGLIKILFK